MKSSNGSVPRRSNLSTQVASVDVDKTQAGWLPEADADEAYGGWRTMWVHFPTVSALTNSNYTIGLSDSAAYVDGSENPMGVCGGEPFKVYNYDAVSTLVERFDIEP